MSARLQSWNLVSNATLYWKTLQDECVVFNSASGQTHLLDPISALFVHQIQQRRQESDELFFETARLLECDLTPEIRTTFEERLWKLEASGLIEANAF